MPTPTVPALISLFNRASLLGNGAPAANTFLQSDELIAKAEQRENLHNWGDEYFSTALAQLTESVRNEGRLSPFGRFAFRNFMLENLTKRLRIIEVIRRFPEITEIPINAPAFITGWYRTGTTYLHNLVTDNADVRAPLFWELRDPCPSLDPKNYPQAKSIRKTIWVERIQRYISPGFQKAHPL
ncbi:MAG: hypothetical protein MJA83_04955, partial [Gammaproteobacteria bacterium]|nr:hypothetical protein [Gammaproteobacteria bacterium]